TNKVKVHICHVPTFPHFGKFNFNGVEQFMFFVSEVSLDRSIFECRSVSRTTASNLMAMHTSAWPR
ncbi:MAG: hypothetical protein ACKPKO_03550, partial [Candidatus Fonsibacter sp.]